MKGKAETYAGDAAWKKWFKLCSVPRCGGKHASALANQVRSAMFAQLGRFGFPPDAVEGDDPVTFFDNFFMAKGTRDPNKPLKSYLWHKKGDGDIGVGHCMTAFYELVPPGAADDVAKVDALKYQKSEPVESDELLTVKLRWKAPDGDVSRLEEMPVRAEAITSEDGASEDFRFASAVAEYALLLENSKFKGEASFRSVIERAKAAKGADASGDRAEFIRLAERAEAYSIVK